MTRPVLVAAALLGFISSGLAAESPKAPVSAIPDFTSFKTGEEAWKALDQLLKPPTDLPKSQDEATAQLVAWLTSRKEAAEAFAKAFPKDQHFWMARLIALRAANQMRRSGIVEATAADQQQLDEVINAPDAPASIRGEAAFLSVLMLQSGLTLDKPEGIAAFYKAAEDYLQKYPEHPLAGEMKTVLMQTLNEDTSAQGTEMLKKVSTGADPRLAAVAKTLLGARLKLEEMKTVPLKMSFTALDGHPFDLANLRGKVVLIDFWATWCGPCMRELPRVVQMYDKLHAKGLEIVGISVDQDKAALEDVLKEQNVKWPQYFDGSASEENKIAGPLGVNMFPTTWLLDKKGLLRETMLRGPELEAAVEKLLAE